MECYTATKKERTTGSNIMNEPHTHYTKKGGQTRKHHILYDSNIYMMFWKRQNYKNRKQIAEDQVWKD